MEPASPSTRRGTPQHLLRTVIRTALLPADDVVTYNLATEFTGPLTEDAALAYLRDTRDLAEQLTVAYNRLNIPYFLKGNNSDKVRLAQQVLNDVLVPPGAELI